MRTPSHRPRRRTPVPRRGTPYLLLLGVLLTTRPSLHAQGGFAVSGTAVPPGMAAAPEEWRLWQLYQDGKRIQARERATAWLKEHPDSFVGHLVLGLVHRYVEANLPKALHHLRKARTLFESRYGSRPVPSAPWGWHARILRETASTLGAMERFVEQLRVYDDIDALYEPKTIALRAWPLMKLRRFDAARRAAHAGLDAGDPWQRAVALNALCAIEFEAGDDAVSHRWCQQAVEFGRSLGTLDPTDVGNLAESARAVFRFDEAERLLLEMSRMEVSWYGNPWRELGDLYLREGRFAEALDALRRVPAYRASRPPHVRNSDRAEDRRTLAAFLLMVGREDEAARLTEQALLRPDRRGQTSRDPAQDRALTALLDRAARTARAERWLEESTGKPLHERLLAWLRAMRERFGAWRSGRKALRLLAAEGRLAGLLQIGKARSAVTPPWLAPDLVQVAGAAVVERAVAEARATDGRPASEGYYTAFATEAAFERGDTERVLKLGARALKTLPEAEALLRARVRLRMAQAAWEIGERRGALADYERVLQRDPGLLRRLRVALPVRLVVRGDAVAGATADAVERSPRFDVGEEGLTVRVEADASGGSACLLGAGGARLGCAEERPRKGDSPETLAARLAAAFHRQAFTPSIDLSSAEINSLDGSNRAARGSLEHLLGGLGEEARPDDGRTRAGTAP